MRFRREDRARRMMVSARCVARQSDAALKTSVKEGGGKRVGSGVAVGMTTVDPQVRDKGRREGPS